MKHKGTLRECYRALQNLTEALQIIMGRYRMLRNVVEVLWGVVERYGTLEHYVTLWKRYGAFTEC